MTPPELLEVIERHLVDEGQDHDGSIVVELEWLAEQVLQVATTVERYGVNGPCALRAEIPEHVSA